MMNTIKPEYIDPLALPSVPLDSRKLLPTSPCIYFAIDGLGNVQYIGRSVNPRQRWAAHHRQSDLESIGEVRIAYLTCEASLLSAVEAALIEWFDPPLNGLMPEGWKPGRIEQVAMARTSITIPESLLERFKELCQAQRRSVSAQLAWMMEEALRQSETQNQASDS